MKQIFLCSTALFLAFSQLIAQPKLIEKVEKKGSEPVIPFEKYQLPNGLTILVHEDHSDPVVYVDVTYHVGSAREQEGRSGFAHFFEHMMFQGSEHVADEQHFKIVTEAGGTLNGTTNTDRTNYFEVMPSNQLEVALWLESDRMGFLLDSVTQPKFEVQRATVKNERGQNYDNRPYGLVGEKIGEAMYPSNHPYSWQTIGYIEDLNRVDVNDLKKFFLRWYGPNNATLTVAGDVKPADVVKLAEKYFGPIPKGADVKPQSFPAVVLDKDRYISYEDKVRMPQLSFAFPTVPSHDPDEAPLDVLAQILAGNKSSIFYKNFELSQMAQSANVYHPTAELAGEFRIDIRTDQNHSLAQMDSLVRASLAEFEKKGVSDEDLKKFKAGQEMDVINSLTTVRGKGAMLAAYQTFTGDANYLPKDIERYKNVTKEDVMRVYTKYLKGKSAVVLSVYPVGHPEMVAKADNYMPPVHAKDAKEAAEYKNLVYHKAKDNFDRNKKPLAGPNPVVHAPDYWTEHFSNGIGLIGTQSDETPTTTLQINIAAGHRAEPIEKAGIARLLASMLNEGSRKQTPEQLAEQLELLGSTVRFSSNDEDISLTVSTLSKNSDASLAIAKEMLFEPRFDAKDFDRLKNQQMEAIENQATQATTVANNVFAKLLYGKGQVMGLSVLGTKESLSSITLDDVKNYYNEKMSAVVTRAVIVSDLDKATALKKLDFLRTWSALPLVPPADAVTPTIDKTRIYVVNKENAPQSQIRIGYMAMKYDATGDFYNATVMNYVLGGAFNSRINLNLREKHGFTYGARSYFSGGKYAGPFVASAGVRGNATDSSVVEFMSEINKYASKGITAAELDFTKKSIGQSEALKYEAPYQKAGFISRILDYNLSKNYIDQQTAILNALTVDQVNKLAAQRLPYNNMIILVVGDKAKIWDGLLKLGYEVVELDSDGNQIGSAVLPEVKAVDPKVVEKPKTRFPQPDPKGRKMAKTVDVSQDKH